MAAPLPFLEPSAKGFSDLMGMLLRAVKWEGIIRVDAKVALRAGSSKLYQRNDEGVYIPRENSTCVASLC